MQDVRYIAIEGAIGAGKTTLASKLTVDLAARGVLEQFEENPFLPDFYSDPERYAFQTQMFFLISRYKQQLELNQLDLFHERIVTDYTFQKDEIFARQTLNAADFALYQQFADNLATRLTIPDIIVYLQSDTDRLLRNIRKRGRPYESTIGADYLSRLQDAYLELFWRRRDLRVLIVDSTRVDFLNDDEQFSALRNHIMRPLETGVHYYIPQESLF